jgi:acyl-CoA thioesterase-1
MDFRIAGSGILTSSLSGRRIALRRARRAFERVRAASCGYGRAAPRINAGPGMLARALALAVAVCAAAGGLAAVAMPTRADQEGPRAPFELLVLGDSLTAGYGLTRADGFVAQLERALAERGLDVRVIDAGVSGDTSAGGQARLPWLLGEDPAAYPNAAIVELGANDALRGVDPAATYRNLADTLSTLKSRGIPTLLTGMLAPPNMGEDYRERFAAIYPRLAEAYDVPLYPFFLQGVAAQPALNQADGLHPNAAGVAEIVERILPHVVSLIEDARAADRPAPDRPAEEHPERPS